MIDATTFIVANCLMEKDSMNTMSQERIAPSRYNVIALYCGSFYLCINYWTASHEVDNWTKREPTQSSFFWRPSAL